MSTGPSFMGRMQRRPCWHCQHWGGYQDNGITSWCDRPGAAPVVAQPEHGCVYWTREPGADDDAEPDTCRGWEHTKPSDKPALPEGAFAPPPHADSRFSATR